MQPPPAQPPQYDIAFVFRADFRVIWPVEAKVLETPGTLAAYLSDVNEQFLTCRYAPFSRSGAMLGYLLNGEAVDAFSGISTHLGCELEILKNFADRPSRFSTHMRSVPSGKAYPADFPRHHLIMRFPAKNDQAPQHDGVLMAVHRHCLNRCASHGTVRYPPFTNQVSAARVR